MVGSIYNNGVGYLEIEKMKIFGENQRPSEKW